METRKNLSENVAVKYLIWLPSALLVCCTLASAQPGERAIGSYLYEPSYSQDWNLHGKTRAYLPQPGDVLLATDVNWFWSLTHDMAACLLSRTLQSDCRLSA